MFKYEYIQTYNFGNGVSFPLAIYGVLLNRLHPLSLCTAATKKYMISLRCTVYTEEGPNVQTGERRNDLEHGQVQRIRKHERRFEEGFGRKLGLPYIHGRLYQLGLPYIYGW